MIEVNTSFQFSLVAFLKRPLSRVVDTGVVGVRGVSSLVLSKVEGWTGFFSNSFKSSWIYRSERRKKNIHVITLSSYSLLWRFWSSSESHPYRYEDWLYSSPSYTYKYWTIRWQFLSKKKSFSRKKKIQKYSLVFPYDDSSWIHFLVFHWFWHHSKESDTQRTVRDEDSLKYPNIQDYDQW